MHCIEQMSLRDALCCSVLQGVVVCCRVLQCVAGCCRMHCIEQMLQGVEVRCRVLQCAGCCRVLQGVAVCCRVLQDALHRADVVEFVALSSLDNRHMYIDIWI